MSSTSHATVQGNFLEAQALQPGYHAQVLVCFLLIKWSWKNYLASLLQFSQLWSEDNNSTFPPGFLWITEHEAIRAAQDQSQTTPVFLSWFQPALPALLPGVWFVLFCFSSCGSSSLPSSSLHLQIQSSGIVFSFFSFFSLTFVSSDKMMRCILLKMARFQTGGQNFYLQDWPNETWA